ncbi:MAG: hypothetical protein ACJ790_11750 [Myxococcaceae bacterium]
MRFFSAAVLAGVLGASPAFAADPQVSVTAEVVQVSKQGNEVQPPALATMRNEFKKNGETAAYTSFKRTSEQKLVLAKDKPQTVKLAPNMNAIVRLLELKEDTAKVLVEVPKLLTTTLTLGKKGALYVRVTKDVDPVTVLVLTPGT